MSAQVPLKVSPLIKGARWSFLIAGFTYGGFRYNRLIKRERKRLEDLERTRPEREAREAEEKQRRSKEEMEELEKLFTS